MAEPKKEDVKPKGPLAKLKEAVDDKDEQMAILSTFVRLGILIWAGGILTLNYVTFPGFAKQDKIDPTFIASVFTGVLASFGIQTASKKNDGTMKMDKNGNGNGGVGGSGGGTVQTIRIEQMPLKIIAADIPASLDPKKDKKPPTV